MSGEWREAREMLDETGRDETRSEEANHSIELVSWIAYSNRGSEGLSVRDYDLEIGSGHLGLGGGKVKTAKDMQGTPLLTLCVHLLFSAHVHQHSL